jgi:phosphatidylglycerol:prolipoprotein diacylglycerol transferase
MHKVAFQLGGLTIYWYGVLLALGFLAGIWTASRRAPLAGIGRERVADLGPWLIVGAIVGARLLYVITYWKEDFAGHPFSEIFMIRKGGLVFYGGLFGAALAHILYCRLKRLPLWTMADILAPSVALGYFFGRLGCLMNGCCYGRACDLPWAIRFPEGHDTWPQRVHPTQVYESLSGLILFGLLAWAFRHRRFDGQIFALYLMGNAVVRFGIEFFRADYEVRHLGGWATQGHMIAILLMAAGVAMFEVRRRLAPSLHAKSAPSP